jgi:hypothetical protein
MEPLQSLSFVALFPNSTLAHAGVFFDVPIETSL